MRRQIKAWLKAGIQDGDKLFPSTEGTPPCGVISPLLANIALHGLEKHLKNWIRGKTLRYPCGTVMRKSRRQQTLGIIRYADDFVIIHKDIEILNEATEITKTWLSKLGLELKTEKTRVCHSLNKHGKEKPGFDFLGFNIRQYKTGKHHANKTTQGDIKPYTLHIKPSKEKYLEHYREIAQIIERYKAAPQKALIYKLNPIIRGWSNYYKYSVCSEIFSKIDHLIFWKLKKWADHRHPNKSWKFKKPKYWKTIGGDNWVFSDGKKNRLIKHKKNYDETKKKTRKKGRKNQGETFKKVQDVRSTYDGDTVYWSSRLGFHPNMPTSKAKMLKWQEGKCPHCGLSFKHEDIMEIDHIIPRQAGGGNSYKNLQLLHRHCHDEKTWDDLKLIAEYQNRKELEKQHNKSIKWFNELFSQEKWKWINDTPVLISTCDKSHVSEEPYEVKISRTVLKTSRRGDSLA